MKVTGAERPRGSGATCICSDLLGTTSLTSVRPQKRLSRGANAGGATTDLSTGKLCGSRSSHRLSDRAPQLRSRQPEHTSGPAPHPSRADSVWLLRGQQVVWGPTDLKRHCFHFPTALAALPGAVPGAGMNSSLGIVLAILCVFVL